ncbi:MAG: glycosyltransferase [Halioglobus sp.]|nr:glycosyltransferase [Halioglobus sp.]
MVTSPLATEHRANRIAVVLPSLEGGGAERSMLNLTKGLLAQGRKVDLVLCQAKGAYLDEIPDGANMVELEPSGAVQARLIAATGSISDFCALLRPVLLAGKVAPETARIRSLQHYIKQTRPDAILSALTYANLTAIWAKRRSGSAVPVIVSERIALTSYCAAPSNFRKWRWRYLPAVVRRTYPSADRVVAVSNFVAQQLITEVGLEASSVTALPNPVVDDNLRLSAAQDLDHPWFADGAPPVILAVGRLTEQKDFATLLRAFALIQAQQEVRLVILGEGRLRDELQALARRLGVQANLDMPGFVENPFKYMKRASTLVLSSQYEGLPGVLIQAMACGCPVVSTDCPGGSGEILGDGEYGALVPVGDAKSMAAAVLASLDKPTPLDKLLQRAEDFSVERATSEYLAVMDSAVKQVAVKR